MSKKSSFLKLTEAMSASAREGRSLEYSEGAIGVTGLIYCPRKVELGKKHPEIKADALEIDEGFLFEKEAKKALVSTWGEKAEVIPEDVLPYESPQGLKVEGHLDGVLRFPKKVVGIEFKRPRSLSHKGLPPELADPEVKLIEDPELVEKIFIPPNWLLQARIQKFLLKRKYPGLKVKHFLYIKTNLSFNGRGTRVKCLVRETKEDFTQEEMEDLIKRFLEDPTPRYGWECETCPYAKAGLCEGVAQERDQVFLEVPDLEEGIQEAIRDYVRAWEALKDLETYLKQALPRDTLVKVKTRDGLRRVGWQVRRKASWNVPKLVAKLGPDVAPYLQVNWRRAGELEEHIFHTKGIRLEDVKKEKEVTEWRGL